MDTRFPPLKSQRQIDAHAKASAMAAQALPSLPWGEWLVAGMALLLLLSF